MNQTLDVIEQQSFYQRVVQMRGEALLHGASLLALGDISAKALAFVFFVMLARFITPAEYGTFRYGLTLGYLGSVLAGAFSTTLMYSLSSPPYAKKKQSLAAVLILSLIGSIAGMLVAFFASSDGTALVIGTVLIILGLSFSYTYSGINKGTQEFGKAGAYPVVSNLVQLFPVIVAALWFPQSVLFVAMASYGLSYFVTALSFEWIKPVPVRITLRGWNKQELREALRFSTPMILSHGAYQALFGIDLICLQIFAFSEVVGIYAAAKVLATAYTIFPNALFGVLMPKTAAEATGSESKYNLKLALLIALIANGCLILVFTLTGPFLLNHLFGAGYEEAAPALFVIGIGMLFYSVCLVMTARATGLGVPNVHTMAMMLGFAATVSASPFLIIRYSLLGAGMSLTFGTFISLMVALFWTVRSMRAQVIQQK